MKLSNKQKTLIFFSIFCISLTLTTYFAVEFRRSQVIGSPVIGSDPIIIYVGDHLDGINYHLYYGGAIFNGLSTIGYLELDGFDYSMSLRVYEDSIFKWQGKWFRVQEIHHNFIRLIRIDKP